MRLRSVLSEALRNVATGTTRTAALAVAAAALFGFLGILDLTTVTKLIEQSQEFESSGASVYVLRAEGAVSGVACEALRDAGSVRAAGALRPADAKLDLTVFPHSPIDVKEISPAFAQVVGIRRPLGSGVLLSEKLADVLGARAGEELAATAGGVRVDGVFAYPEDGRAPVLEYSAIAPVPATDVFDECWIDLWAGAADARQFLALSLVPSTPPDTAITISQLNSKLGESFNGNQEFRTRPTRWAVAASVVLGLVLGYISIRARRLEIASAIHCGVSRPAQAVQLMVETMIWSGGAILLCAATIVLVNDVGGGMHRGELFWTGFRCAVAGCAASVLAAGLAGISISEKHLLRYFKERN